MTADLWYLSAKEVGALLRRREVSALEVVQAMLERIDSLDSRFNAFITVTADEAQDTARRMDAELAEGKDRGPLHGIPVAIKDLYDTAGVRTTSGSKILADNVPEDDATSVAKLRAAGAVIVGKTNLNEFACGVTTTNAHYGDTQNPWKRGCIPGGSSGGSAAAVAAGFCTMATGTDTGGSIRIPAALCGIVGLKPTYGRISTQGIMPLSWEQDHPGPMTRTVYDAAIMLRAMAGWDMADPATVRRSVPDYGAVLGGDLEGLRVGVDHGYALRGISAEVGSAFEAALEVLTGLEAQIVRVQVPGLEDGLSASMSIWNSEASAVHEEWLSTRPEDYDPAVRARLEKALGVSGLDYARAQRARRKLMRELQMLFDQVDLLVTPMSGLPAPGHGATQMVIDGQEYDVLTAFTWFSRVFNLTGSPSISVPCGFTSGGLPIGLQLVGALFDEATVLRAAHAYEQATEWHRRWPPIS
jgi:aspartyl-tRNA(Asn)/glutamyl-tRNA(Gln) amidotransferase subunit A